MYLLLYFYLNQSVGIHPTETQKSHEQHSNAIHVYLELNYSGLGVTLQADPSQLYLMVISQIHFLLTLECLKVLYLATYFSFST